MFLIVQDQEIDITEFVPKRVAERVGEALVTGHFDNDKTEEEWEEGGVTQNDKLLRFKLWQAFENAAAKGTAISIRQVTEGIVATETFYRILKNPIRTAYIFTRPLDLGIRSQLLLEIANRELQKILELPLYNSKGNINVGIINAKIKIADSIRDRVEGQAVQRVQQHTVRETKKPETQSVADLERELEKLEGSTVRELPIREV